MPQTGASAHENGSVRGIRGVLQRAVLGVWDTFLRDNRVVPPVLAIIALVIFSWVVAGAFIGNDAQDQPVSNRQEIAQSPEEANPAPEIENPDSDSYAAYQSKDPFRQIFDPASSGETTDQGGDDGSGNDGSGGNGGNNENNPPRTDETTDPDNSPAGNQYDQNETTNRNQNNNGNNQNNNGNNQSNNGGNNSSSDDDLFDSGGDLLPPP